MLDGLNIKNPMSGPKRLRELVKDIRSARTAAEERAIVNKECALIRDSFRSENQNHRCRNVAKLLYIHMLGYPAHFGQLECLKLIASPRFTDKRVGYLGAMLLLDERTDVHLLVTNSLKNDLNHTTPYVVSLALCTLGSICSVEMSRDLAGEVERIIKGPNLYLKKKAALCAFRIIRRVPDLLEVFIPCTKHLIQEKSHGVMLATMTLITEMCKLSRDTLVYFRKLVPQLIRTIKNLLIVGYSGDHEVNRVGDPFLQVKILRLMRLLGQGDRAVSEQLNDVLAQVATNTETSKNVGHAILYEIVLTIMGIESDPGLRVLAVNILGRFLLNTDKNIRYVALNTLKQVVDADFKAVQRHRNTILDCLKDADVSIQRRAIDLCFMLANGSNIQIMIREILLYLTHCDNEFKGDVCTKILLATEQYSPTKKWHFDSILQLLVIAGNQAREDVVSSFVALTSQMADLHAYAVHRLFLALKSDMRQQPLVQVASWCIGEYGDLLCHACDETLETADSPPMPVHFEARTEEEVLDVLESALTLTLTNALSKQMTLVAITKLNIRFSPNSHARIQKLVKKFGSSTMLELQQRSVEFSAILAKPPDMQRGLLECMPPMESRLSSTLTQEVVDTREATESSDLLQLNGSAPNGQTSHHQDLMDLLGGGNDLPTNASQKQTNSNNAPASNDLLDLLFSNNDNSLAKPALVPAPNAAMDNFNSLFGDLGLSGSAPVGQSQSDKSFMQTAYEKNGLKVILETTKVSSTQMHIKAVTSSSLVMPLHDFELLAAVPKSFQLHLQPPSSSTLVSGMPITQLMEVTNNERTPVRIRLKLQYKEEGVTKVDQTQIDNFPPELWS